MSKTIVITGFGPGVSRAVAEKFGTEGFTLALVARNEDHLAIGAEELRAQGLGAAIFPADAGDPIALRGAIARVRAELGSIGVLHWNAYNGRGIGDLLTVDAVHLYASFDLAVVGLLSAVQDVLPDLKAAGDGAVLVTNGAYGIIDSVIDGYAIAANAEGVALGNAAKAKLVGLLAARLKNEGVYVGEVTIAGNVRSASEDNSGLPTIEPTAIARQFWQLYKSRDKVRATVS